MRTSGYGLEGMRRRLEANELVLCVSFAQARTVDYVLMAAACGFDAIYVDLEHTATSLETTSMLCVAAIGCGITPLVRVPSHHPHYLTRVVDNGAVGVIVPHVDTREQAQLIVDTCRFPPVGRRGIIGPNPANRYRQEPLATIVETLNRQTVLAAMLETPTAIERADEIASVDGLDLILIGSYDLSTEMGIFGQYGDLRFREAVAKAAGAARRHDKIMGIAGVWDPTLLAEFIRLGVRFISAGNDVGFFMEAATAHAGRLRAIPLE